MGDNGHAARACNRGYAVFQCGPFMSDGTGFAVAQIFGKCLLFVFDMAFADEEFGNMGAAGHFFVGGQCQRTFIRACYAFFLQFDRDGFQSFQTAFADFCKAGFAGLSVVFVKVQADNVDGAAAPSDGYFHAVDEGEAEGIGFGTCFGKSAGMVVVG